MVKTAHKNIRQLTLSELEQYFATIGEKKFRTKQVWEWLWQKGAQSFADMTNLSKELRQKLGENFALPALAIDTTQHSADGTVKTRFKTHEGHLCEGVLIPTENRYTAPDGLAMSPRRITVSTAGVAKQIRQLGDDNVKFKLALSLHAPNDAKRNEIMPINESNNLKALTEALNYFYKQTKNEITFEYILFNNFNDSQKDADEFIRIYRQVPADLFNIIDYNPID